MPEIGILTVNSQNLVPKITDLSSQGILTSTELHVDGASIFVIIKFRFERPKNKHKLQ